MTYAPAEICRQLEEREERARPRRGRISLDGHTAALERRRTMRNPIRPSAATVREAELQAAEATHALEMAGPDCPPDQLDYLRRQAGETRARAHRLRHAA